MLWAAAVLIRGGHGQFAALMTVMRNGEEFIGE
jgi:hypothetical protein